MLSMMKRPGIAKDAPHPLLDEFAMDLLILGFSQSGKTSLFNALTHRQAAPGGRSGGSVGVAKVPDARLVPLTEMFKAPACRAC